MHRMHRPRTGATTVRWRLQVLPCLPMPPCPGLPCPAVPSALVATLLRPLPAHPQPLRVSCYFNPAVLLADAVRGKVGAADFWALAASIVAGHFTGGCSWGALAGCWGHSTGGCCAAHAAGRFACVPAQMIQRACQAASQPAPITPLGL